MGRMINTDAAYAVLTAYYHHSTDTQHAALKEALEMVPTVDTVPVVRCRDCEYWDTIPRSTVAPLHHQCKETRLMTTGIWYCPLGKRKDGEHHD